MKALDTNILVRFLVNDNKKQAAQVKNLFQAAEIDGRIFVIPIPVVLEMLWVLDAVYECSRASILNALEELAMLPILAFENSDQIHQLIHLGRSSNTDLPELLIGISARHLDCDATLTLDRKAAKSPLFESL